MLRSSVLYSKARPFIYGILLIWTYLDWISEPEPDSFERNGKFSYDTPPKLENKELEYVRLNEFIAYTAYQCNSSIRIPKNSQGFLLCLDSPFTNGVNKPMTIVAAVNAADNLDFANNADNTILNGNNLYLVASSNDIPIESGRNFELLKGDLVSHPDHDSNIYDLQRLYDVIRQQHHVTKVDLINLDSTDFKYKHDLPLLIAKGIRQMVFSTMAATYLLITVRLEALEENLAYDWYRALNDLYFHEGFMLYDAVQLGVCGRTVRHCEYRLSFGRVNAGASTVHRRNGASNGAEISGLQNRDLFSRLHHLIPIAGLGSPEEEKIRLLDLILHVPKARPCKEPTELYGNSWRLCVGSSLWNSNRAVPGSDKLCSIFFATIETKPDELDAFNSLSCDLFVLAPILNRATLPRYSNVVYKQYLLGSAINKIVGADPSMTQETTWDQLPLLSWLDMLQYDFVANWIDVLALDLRGGEWGVMENALASGVMKHVRQLLIRLYIWDGEENHNYREITTWFYRLRSIGFKMVYARKVENSLSENQSPIFSNGDQYSILWVND